MIKDLLVSNIQKVDNVDNWKDAVKLSCKPLINKGFIKEEYADDIINNVEKNGPYIILDEGFALPHANRGRNVIKTSLSFLHVKNGVDLLGNTVYAFLTLAAADNDTHLQALMELSGILDDDDNMKKVLAGNIEELIN